MGDVAVYLHLTAGMRLSGAACTTEIVVVKAPQAPVDLRIGGHPALKPGEDRVDATAVTTPPEAAAVMGKRYVDVTGELEVLCVKAGAGAISVGDDLCEIKDAKPLPSSD